MTLRIVTGMSGSGVSTALHALEDAGFLVVDAIPPSLWNSLAERVDGAGREALAIAVDVRIHEFLEEAPDALRALTAAGFGPQVIYLDARDEVLVRRFNFTRRTHPFGHGSLQSALERERKALRTLRECADVVVDTSSLAPKELRARMQRLVGEDRFHVRLVSFGYKRGLPTDVDAVLDVRGLRNPYYQPDLRERAGTDPEVAAYVFADGGLEAYARLRDMVRSLARSARESGRGSYAVAIGCTGGQHRSVAVVERLEHDLAEIGITEALHRDLPRALAEHKEAESEA